MRVLLDTQAFIVLAEQGIEVLSRKARTLVEDPANDRLFSAISITELAIKSALGKLSYGTEITSSISEKMGLINIPYTARHAMQLFDLPLHHHDPFDRMLIATALVEGVPVVTSDREFKRYRGLSVIW